MLNCALSGANGRMGKAIIAQAKHDLEFKIALTLTSTNSITNLLGQLKFIDVFIEFSNPQGCEDYLTICKELKIPMVIGTTGLSAKQQQKLIETAKYIPIIQAPNMSIGVNICYNVLAIVSKNWDYGSNKKSTVEIKEVHHKHKKDAPSGTALKMAEIIKKNSSTFSENLEINFISKRIGNAIGKHQVKFSNFQEEIIITHKAKNRASFAKGAIIAAKWLINKPNKLYNLSEIFVE